MSTGPVLRSTRLLTLAILVGSLPALVGCSGDARSPRAAVDVPAVATAASASPTLSASATAVATEYCALAADLDRFGTEFFADLEAREDATEEEYAARERDMLPQISERMERLEQVSPSAIASEVALVVRSVRERAGEMGADPVDADAAQRAQDQVLRWEEDNCEFRQRLVDGEPSSPSGGQE